MQELLAKIDNYHNSKKDMFDTIKIQTSEITKLNSEITDYLHILELLPLKASEINKITAQLRVTLKRRRDLKLAADLSCTLKNPNTKGAFVVSTAEELLTTYTTKLGICTEEATESYNRLMLKA